MTYSYFSFSGEFCKKINGVPMGLLLSPIINSHGGLQKKQHE